MCYKDSVVSPSYLNLLGLCYIDYEVIKQRCELQQIYNETSLLLRPNNFFLTPYFGDTHCLIYQKSNSSNPQLLQEKPMSPFLETPSKAVSKRKFLAKLSAH